MKKVSIVLIIALMISMLLCACGGNPIVGSWTGSLEGVPLTMVFDEDGSGSLSAMGGLLAVNYTYTAENGVLTLIPEEGSEDIATFNEGANYEIDGDTLTISNDGETMTLTRDE